MKPNCIQKHMHNARGGLHFNSQDAFQCESSETILEILWHVMLMDSMFYMLLLIIIQVEWGYNSQLKFN